jgi:hypothetical protein
VAVECLTCTFATIMNERPLPRRRLDACLLSTYVDGTGGSYDVVASSGKSYPWLGRCCFLGWGLERGIIPAGIRVALYVRYFYRIYLLLGSASPILIAQFPKFLVMGYVISAAVKSE